MLLIGWAATLNILFSLQPTDTNLRLTVRGNVVHPITLHQYFCCRRVGGLRAELSRERKIDPYVEWEACYDRFRPIICHERPFCKRLFRLRFTTNNGWRLAVNLNFDSPDNRFNLKGLFTGQSEWAQINISRPYDYPEPWCRCWHVSLSSPRFWTGTSPLASGFGLLSRRLSDEQPYLKLPNPCKHLKHPSEHSN